MANSTTATYFNLPLLFIHQKVTSHLSTSTQFTTQRLCYPRPPTNLKFWHLGRSSFCRRKHDVGGGGRLGATHFNVFADDGSTLETQRQAPAPIDTSSSESRGRIEDGYVGLFVRMLGLDNDPLDREQAVNALWKYSLGGKECIDEIMKFPGCINLSVSLLRSESKTTSEAAAGLLRSISAINLYRTAVSAGGAIEEITGLLSRSVVSAEVKEQSICTLWNLSVDEQLRVKISNSVLLRALIKCLDDEDIKVKEASGGVLANLALSQCNHGVMVEEGIIPKLAGILKCNEGSKVVKKEARNILSELAKDEYYRILIVEAGLVLVPIIGGAAYKSLSPVSRSWPSLPDGTEFERSSSIPSRFGASELLLGLNIQDEDVRLGEAQQNAIVGRTTQQFLARVGAIETEEGDVPNLQPAINRHSTFLPWIDGVARLVLILGLEDVSALEKAALSIADACINEHMRISFKEAGALKNLVRLLEYDIEPVRLAAAHALEKLSISNVVCQAIAAHCAIDTLVDILKKSDTSEDLLEKILNIVARLFDPVKEMKYMIHGGSFYEEQVINGVSRSSAGTSTPLSKGAFREKVLESGVIPNLVGILKRACPNLQHKAAIILENLADDEPYTSAIVAADVQAGLSAVFLQRGADVSGSPEPSSAVVEESGRAISAASQLLAKLLSFEQCQNTIDTAKFIHLLHGILKSGIPLHTKDWVAACLVKLESLADQNIDLESPINKEVILHGTIPRLIEEIESSDPTAGKEEAIFELNHIISQGAIEYAREVAARGGIFPLVKVIDEGGESTREAGLAILYNLSMDNENHAAIVAAGAIPVLRRIVLSEGPLWMRALHLLRTLPTPQSLSDHY